MATPTPETTATAAVPTAAPEYNTRPVILMPDYVLFSICPKSPEVRAMYVGHGTYHEGDVGLDVFMPTRRVIPPHTTMILPTGICATAMTVYRDIAAGGTGATIGSPTGFLLYPRSSMAKGPLRLANSVGVFDSGYRGEVMVALDNNTDEDAEILPGQRLVQLCGAMLSPVKMVVVDKLDETTRCQGFGSTGGTMAVPTPAPISAPAPTPTPVVAQLPDASAIMGMPSLTDFAAQLCTHPKQASSIPRIVEVDNEDPDDLDDLCMMRSRGGLPDEDPDREKIEDFARYYR